MKNKTKTIVYGLFIVILIFVSILASKIGNSTSTAKWKTHVDKNYSFSIEYPASYKMKSKVFKKPEGINKYFYSGKEEVFQLHVYREPKPTEIHEFYQRLDTISGNTFEVIILPNGLDLGEIRLTAPVLYYMLYRQGVKYSFQFNMQDKLTPLQKSILSSLKFTN